MRTRTKIVVGSLVGAAAIHALLAACGGGSGAGGRDGGAGVPGWMDALADVFRGSDAMGAADAGAPAPGSCSCTSTSSADDPTHWVTSSAQFPTAQGANMPVTKIADGPFVLRHIFFAGFNPTSGSLGVTNALFLASDGQCGSTLSSIASLIDTPDATKHMLAGGVTNSSAGPITTDGREVWVAVPGGSTLCAGLSFTGGGVVGWSGFTP